jgi:hypothetical protein
VGYLASLNELAHTSLTSFEASDTLAQTLETAGHTARALRGPTGRISFSLRRLAELSQPIFLWAERATTIMATRNLTPGTGGGAVAGDPDS